MNSKANRCWPVIVVAGILALGSAAARAADTTDQRTTATKLEQHGRHHVHHASRSRAEKHVEKAAAQHAETSDRKNAGAAVGPADLPPAIANAQAQLTAPDAGASSPGTSQPATPAPAAQEPAPVQDVTAEPAPAASAEVPILVAADELNDVDRAAQPEKPMGKIFRPLPLTPYLSNPSSEDTWNQTSLIGKVFIVMGGCLTLASAARMFVA